MAESTNHHFQKLIDQGQPLGSIVAVNKALIKVNGLQPSNMYSLVLFENGEKGYVAEIKANYVLVYYLGTKPLNIGMRTVLQHTDLVSRVGSGFLGRVVNVFGKPLDGLGAIVADAAWPVFNRAPKLYERQALSDSLETGVTVLDSIVPIVKGQRLAIIGDNKTGKSMLATQIALNQIKNDIVVIYVLIAKNRHEVSSIVSKFKDNDAFKNTIIIVSTIYDSIVASYLAPYIGCAMAEYFWQKQERDSLIIYDDLTTHAMIYRELALLNNISPGRDSYPGDIFYIHSSLLERSGRLNRNSKTLTALPIVLAAGGDITAYLPTNIMSITDGQWILDMQVFKDIMRPALNIGLSVTRVGGVGFNNLQKELNLKIMKLISAYKEALEFSHFGSELAIDAQNTLLRGRALFKVLNQNPNEHLAIWAQVLMLDLILDIDQSHPIDVDNLKPQAIELANEVQSIDNYPAIKAKLFEVVKVELKR